MSVGADPACPGAASAASDARFAGYTLVRPLGKGGLGEVFEAMDAKQRRVAIKTCRIADDEHGLVAAAFAREIELAGHLQHPDIVRVLAGGVHGQHAYLVMELVPGVDLRAHAHADTLLAPSEVLRIVERVSRAVAAAHAVGVIHRDLKPGNVLFDAASDSVKVSDFGLARLGDVFRSRTGVMAGTPGYMSPEQLAETPVGPACDLYALGVMLFELLSGRLPHEAATLGQLLQQVATTTPPLLAHLRPGLPAGLCELVAQLLEKRPEARPASAVEVADRLATLRSGLAPSA